MSSYVVSILGIVLAGVIIEIIIPSGAINKYIKGIYSLFVVAVIISPIINFSSKENDFKLVYNDYTVDEELFEYISKQRINSLENTIEKDLKDKGFNGLDINIDFSIENNSLIYKKCDVNLENLVIDLDNQHINKYEFITEVVIDYTNLAQEEIIFSGEQR